MKERALFLISLLLTAACSGTPGATTDTRATPDRSTPDSGVRDGRVGPDGQVRLSFSSCTLLTDPSRPPAGFEGVATAMAECATTKVPSLWSNPTGDSLSLFVKRYPAATQPAKGQLWLLSGGPGDAGAVFEALAFRVAKSIPDTDIYIPDHRGTGKSSFAWCLVTPQTVSLCTSLVPHLDGLTATDAARDLAALIDATRVPSQQVFVLGHSYGAYWAQRYLQIRPTQPTAVILESPCPAVGFDFAVWDKQIDDNAHQVLALCQADATCSAKLGADPVPKATQALAGFDSGTCKISGWSGDIRKALGSLLLVQYYERLLLPASIYRLLRCNSADQSWLSTVFGYASSWSAKFYPMQPSSSVVWYNVGLSELWLSDVTQGDLAAQEKTMLAYGGWPPGEAALAPLWPKYPRDAFWGSWPSSPVPILVAQSGLDPRTPYGSVMKAHYSGPKQHYVEFPRANHGAAWGEDTPTTDPNDAYGCGWHVIQSFLADPTKAPDTSCTAKMAPLDWGNPPAWWLARVGVADLWENP